MPAPPLYFEESIDAKIARAIVILINGDESKFATYYSGRARWIPPTIEDSFVVLPDCMIQIVTESGSLNRLVGGQAGPLVNVRLLLWEPARVEPYHPGEYDVIENLIVHMERLFEAGSKEPDGSRNGVGKLIDPDSETADVPMERYLNTRMPKLVRLSPIFRDLVPRDRTRERRVEELAVIYPLVVTYETLQNRNTRRRT